MIELLSRGKIFFKRQSLAIGIALFLAFLTMLVQNQGWLQRWSYALYDIELGLLQRPANPEIMVAAIDEYSLKILGRWPWPRRTHAAFVDRLTAAGVKAAALDIIFSEPDRNDPESDRLLAEAIRRNGRIVLPVLAEKPKADSPLAVVRPLPLFARAASGVGHADLEPGKDGIVRSVFLKAGTHAERWPALALELLEVAAADRVPPDMADLKFMNTAPYSAYWQRSREIFIPFLAHGNAFKQVSYADIVLERVAPETLHGKIILTGMTAAGLAPTFAVPDYLHARLITGVEMHANILNTLLEGLDIYPLPRHLAGGLSFSIVFLAVFSYSLLRSPWQGLLSALLFCLLSVVISAVLLKTGQRWYTPAPTLLCLVLSYPLWSWGLVDRIARALFQERQRAVATLQAIGDAVVTTSINGGIDYMNTVAETMCGYTLDEARDKPIDRIFPVIRDNCNTELLNICQKVRDGQSIHTTSPCFLKDINGNEYAVRISANPIKDRKGKAIGQVYAFTDVSKLLQISREMANLATYDPLTGLLNRSMTQNCLNRAIMDASRSGKYLAVLFIDLDGFNKVNDALGHAVGDQALKEIAKRLSKASGQTDAIGRWGSDEFVVIAEQITDDEAAVPIANAILEHLTQPFNILGHELFIAGNIGISLFPKDGLTGEALLSRADTAMYRAKKKGCNNFAFFSQGLDESAKQRLFMEREMHHALDNRNFQIYYQPQVDLKTKRIVRLEALLQWHHELKGFIPPGHFIPLAEEIGLIKPIGEWVITTVCGQLNQWFQAGLPRVGISINVTSQQFMQPDFCRFILDVLTRNNLAADLLQIEIRESTIIKDVHFGVKMLEDLHAAGIAIAIEDFGAGYSSLNNLKLFQADELKIDKSFIKNIAIDIDDAQIALSLISLAHGLRMGVTAVGVETPEQLAFLSRHHCDRAQGYFFSKPLDAAGIAQLLRNNEGYVDIPGNGKPLKDHSTIAAFPDR